VPFDHPLWVLFSSGTTGLPKALVHGHGGILLEHLKGLALHMDVRPGDRPFSFTTTGWMVFNWLTSTLLHGASPVLYDGSPTYPQPDALWQLAADTRATYFGTSPSFIDIMQRKGIVPRDRFDLSAIRTVSPAGSPVSPACTAWFLHAVGPDVWVATASGGTDCCASFVGGVPTIPVYAGEIQARLLGVNVQAVDDDAKPVIGEVGELIISEPMPSMPLRLFGDVDGSRLLDAYFSHFRGVWRHGDLIKINERGGCFVLGRSDATLNRYGVRIGTAEIYRALESLPAIEDGLAIGLTTESGQSVMCLFLSLVEGRELDGELLDQVRGRLREEFSPRHVPDHILSVADIPRTLTGKRMEVPVRQLLLGAEPGSVADRSAMANPETLEEYAAIAADPPWGGQA